MTDSVRLSTDKQSVLESGQGFDERVLLVRVTLYYDTGIDYVDYLLCY